MNVFALSTVGGGIDTLRATCGEVPLKGIIGLTKRESDGISGFVDASEFAQAIQVPFIPVETYSLSSPSDKVRLMSLDIDVLLVVGWQRLIPDWLIGAAKIAAIGVHGSAYGIAGGRGRSPQNWAIMLGASSFSVSLFLIQPGIDDGPILATGEFSLTATDHIADSYRKSAMVTGRMLAKLLNEDSSLSKQVPQSKDGFYLPQRLPEDGALDWNRSADEVLSFIRALSKPYPGAFVRSGENVIKIWEGSRYDLDELPPVEPGTIRLRFTDGSLLIACGQGDVLISSWEAYDRETVVTGAVLPSVSFKDQIGQIIRRHVSKYPDLPIAPALARLVSSGFAG